MFILAAGICIMLTGLYSECTIVIFVAEETDTPSRSEMVAPKK